MPETQMRVAVVGLGWWGRIIVGLLKGSAKLSVARVVTFDESIPGSMSLRFLRIEPGARRYS